MVYVVRALPPADGQAAAEISDEGADEGILDKIARDASVASIVGCKHNLLLNC